MEGVNLFSSNNTDKSEREQDSALTCPGCKMPIKAAEAVYVCENCGYKFSQNDIREGVEQVVAALKKKGQDAKAEPLTKEQAKIKLKQKLAALKAKRTGREVPVDDALEKVNNGEIPNMDVIAQRQIVDLVMKNINNGEEISKLQKMMGLDNTALMNICKNTPLQKFAPAPTRN